MKSIIITTNAMLLTLMLSIFLAACKKDHEATLSLDESMLVAHPWKLIAAKINPAITIGGTLSISDIYTRMGACEKDNLLHFNVDKTYHLEDAGQQCKPKSDENGSWMLKDRDNFEFNGSKAKITELSEDSFKMEIKTNKSGRDTTMFFTYIRR